VSNFPALFARRGGLLPPMSFQPLDSDDSDELEEALESTRRNVRQLEMDTCRVRNDLTRLEVALEGGIANRPHTKPPDGQPAADHHADQPLVRVNDESVEPVAIELDPFGSIPSPTAAPNESPLSTTLRGIIPDSDNDSEASSELSVATVFGHRARRTYRYLTSPVVASLILHGAIILAIVSMTVATIVHAEKPFAATIVELGEKPPAQLDASETFDLGKVAPLDETDLSEPLSDSTNLDASGPLVDEVAPVDFESVSGPVSLGDAGLVTANPSDLGIVLPGIGGLGPDDAVGPPAGLGDGNQKRAGGGGGGRNAGLPGAALFFGTKAKGNRFVFVIDNSSSMKGGRLEMALAELVKTVESLTPRQSFYVIFVSDQTYPMFYPQLEPDMIPATPLHKTRLVEWLPKAILTSGKNRELIKAMDTAAALRPQAVYLLWDGDMKYSETVRLDVMTHLTAPNQWKFTVHTIGMGLTSLDSEQNLTAIAQAHGGMFRRIEVPTARKR
jgi:von Willebrand factor type A domain